MFFVFFILKSKLTIQILINNKYQYQYEYEYEYEGGELNFSIDIHKEERGFRRNYFFK